MNTNSPLNIITTEIENVYEYKKAESNLKHYSLSKLYEKTKSKIWIEKLFEVSLFIVNNCVCVNNVDIINVEWLIRSVEFFANNMYLL